MFSGSLAAWPTLEVWGGPECTLNRIGDRYSDQLERSGHAARIDDLERWAELGLKALRYPVLWERTAPDAIDRFQWEWSDERLARIRALGMRPIVGLLHHGSGPRYTSLLDPQFPEKLAAFAGAVARRYPWIVDFTPVNEPLTTARFSGLYGHWYPHRRDDRSFVRALLNQVHGVALAMRAIWAVTPGARLLQTEDCGRCFGTLALQAQVDFENDRRWLTWDLLLGRVDLAHPLRGYLLAHGASAEELDGLCAVATPIDVLGLNYYVTSDRFLDHRLDRYPRATYGGNGRLAYADVDAVRARPEGGVGHAARLREAWERYGQPLALSEVHLACSREDQLRWLWQAWKEARASREAGVPVLAVTSWALLGAYDWDSLVTRFDDHYEPGAFDIRSPRPRATAVAGLLSALSSEAPPPPTLTGPGWWHRPGRLLYNDEPSAEPVHQARGRPILIVGAGGTLGRAFSRVCRARGLATVSVTHADLDVGEPAAAARIIRALGPWAVINAAGYVRVDDAEQDAANCIRVNHVGAAGLAAACVDEAAAFVTFSSDLVFDGATDRPYVETDSPRPLSVYGASKAAAEADVLAQLPAALVIRTSAFFGPWDSANFVARMLAALAQGQTWRAAEDLVVSPTYVPDLVSVTLDLLQDGESGLWHLCNRGAVTWYEFALIAAAACGADTRLLRPVPAAAFNWPAARPVRSALASVRGRLMPSLDDAMAAYASGVERPAVVMG